MNCCFDHDMFAHNRVTKHTENLSFYSWFLFLKWFWVASGVCVCVGRGGIFAEIW